MKKFVKILSVLVITLCSLLLASCGDEKLDFEYVKNITKTSQPYKYETSIVYTNGELMLHSESDLIIEKQGDVYKAKYSYEQESLNPITDENLPKIATTSGVTYYNGDNIGYLVGTEVEWQTNLDLNMPNLIFIDLSDANFESIKLDGENEEYIFEGVVKSDKISSVLGNKTNNITDLALTLSYSDNVNWLKVNYSLSNLATVTIEIKYSYENQIVNIPN